MHPRWETCHGLANVQSTTTYRERQMREREREREREEVHENCCCDCGGSGRGVNQAILCRLGSQSTTLMHSPGGLSMYRYVTFGHIGALSCELRHFGTEAG
jgi:hypothetical protein